MNETTNPTPENSTTTKPTIAPADFLRSGYIIATAWAVCRRTEGRRRHAARAARARYVEACQRLGVEPGDHPSWAPLARLDCHGEAVEPEPEL